MNTNGRDEDMHVCVRKGILSTEIMYSFTEIMYSFTENLITTLNNSQSDFVRFIDIQNKKGGV